MIERTGIAARRCLGIEGCEGQTGWDGDWVWFPVVSLVPSSTTGCGLSSLRDEEAGGEGAAEDGFAGEKRPYAGWCRLR